MAAYRILQLCRDRNGEGEFQEFSPQIELAPWPIDRPPTSTQRVRGVLGFDASWIYLFAERYGVEEGEGVLIGQTVYIGGVSNLYARWPEPIGGWHQERDEYYNWKNPASAAWDVISVLQRLAGPDEVGEFTNIADIIRWAKQRRIISLSIFDKLFDEFIEERRMSRAQKGKSDGRGNFLLRNLINAVTGTAGFRPKEVSANSPRNQGLLAKLRKVGIEFRVRIGDDFGENNPFDLYVEAQRRVGVGENSLLFFPGGRNTDGGLTYGDLVPIIGEKMVGVNSPSRGQVRLWICKIRASSTKFGWT